MPSKKARGKARREAKEAKAAEEMKEEAAVKKDGSSNNQDGSLEAQMQRLMIENLLSAVCLHGFEVEANKVKLCHDFSIEFDNGYNAKFNSGNTDLPSLFNAGWNAAVAEGKVDEICGHGNDVAKFRQVVSYNVAEAVRLLLDGHDHSARILASFAYYFEERIAVYVEETQPLIKWQQIAELQHGDLHTLVKFLRKRIPCKCLDRKYKEVKSVTKMGLCCNNDCFLSGKKVAQSELLYCAGCRAVCYCCPECQKAHWPHRKSLCKQLTWENARFYNK